MATAPSIQSRPKSRFLRGIGFLLVAQLLAVVGVSAWLYFIARSALPPMDGNMLVSGLTEPVTVIRDDRGIPTIEASNFNDLFFAQGYITAENRLFQIDATRRYAAGELAEVIGESQLGHDRQQRILGLRDAAQRNTALLSAADRANFEAYTRGVNAFIQSHRDRLPIEFRILRYAPQPWTIEDSMLMGAYMVQDLSTSPRHALIREKILAKLGPELTADLYVNSSWRDRPPTIVRKTLDQAPDKDEDNDNDDDDDSGMDSAVTGLTRFPAPRTAPHLLENQPAFFDDPPQVLGSNNWVVSGAHTVSGKPLLSNDMHLGHQMPNLWYEAHLRCTAPDCENFDVAGVTLPGYPYVIVGHNQRIAWGFTNVGPTVEDVYVETFNPTGQYLTPEGWKTPVNRREMIHVKGKPDVIVDVALTRHGPIVTDLVPGETRKLALRWTLYDGIHNPFFAVNSARNWTEFQQALSQFDAPGQNVVYADVDGNIGYHATGKVPVRASGDGSLPEDGSNNSHEWAGYIPFEKLPSIFNPSSGIITTANGRITPRKYPFSVSTEWEAPWRTARIYRILESGRKFSASDMLALQADIYSELDRLFADKLVYSIDHASKPSARARISAEILRQWDGRMTADSAAPTIAVRAREELVRLLLEPKLGAAPADTAQAKATLNWKSYSWMMQTVWLENVIQHQPKRWLPETYANYDELLAAAVESAVNSPDVPQDLNSWRWGKFNSVEIQNPVLAQIPILRNWTGTGLREQSGSPFTVKAATRTHGPSERMTVDLDDLDHSTINLVTGEDGNFLDPYYLDQWNAWYKNFTFPWPFSPQAVQNSQMHRIILEPRK
jgi:penicillin amidase